MKGYKAFQKGLICRGKQYTENTVFEEDCAVICKKGMHFCKEPLEVLNYYPLVDENGNMSEFAEVEALDEPKTDDNKKFCTKKLKIGAKISFARLVQASVNFEYEKTKSEAKPDSENIKSSGDDAQIGSSGNYARIGSSCYNARIGSSCYNARIGSSGDDARIGSSGDDARIGSSGYNARIGSSGYNARIGSSGDDAQIGSSGYNARIGSSGDDAQIGSSGDDAQIKSSGKYSVVNCAGHNCAVSAKIGSWITLAEWKWSDEEKMNIPVCVKTEKVDGVRIKEDTFYKLINGEFTEAEG